MNLAQNLANLKKKGYRDSFAIENNKTGNNRIIGMATSM
jgi:hypothetical protein